jgi:sugar phosphate isomerase/epimerase
MFKSLNPGAIGIHGLSLAETIGLAQKTGFDGVEFSIREAATLADARGVDYVRDLFQNAGVLPGHWALPVAWNKDDLWEQDLEQLPQLAALARDLGCTRTATWCISGSNERDYEENFAWHVARFRSIAEVLKEYGCHLGIEFIGPKTLRDGFLYPFIYTMEAMMELAGAIGTGNVGLLLDAYHLHTSGGSVEDLDKIAAQDVVVVHVNDAPEGITRDELMDTIRRLPMETGVIDLPGFMRRLDGMGYDGPVMAEPFSQSLNEIASRDPVEAARLTAEAMDRLWQAGGLG